MTTPTVFIIKNQSGQFLTKQSEWIDARDTASLYRTVHRDEAVNTVFEVSSKDMYLRAEIQSCPVDAKGHPALDAMPSPQAADEIAAETLTAATEEVDSPQASDPLTNIETDEKHLSLSL